YDVALDEVRKIRALRPDWELGVLAEAQLLARTDPAQASGALKNYLETHPGLRETRVFSLGVMMKQNQYPEARELVRKMQAEHPDNFELAFAAAGLSVQMGELDRAESELRATLQNGNQDQNTVYYYLGRLYDEEMARKDDALASYLKVTDGEYAYPAHLRAAFLLYEAGKLSEARARLQQTPTKNDTQRVELLLAESRMLNDTGQPEAAYDVLKRGLEKLPDQPGLLYETAMQAIRLDKHAEFERMMRQVIALSPQQAQAYNAIGYSLLDRNERVKEGVALVKKAYALDPDDPAIMDSMGWAYYRMGDLEKSLEFLRRAYALLPDPEIAAHLGEILWLLDKRDEAKRVWENALAAHPDDAALRAAIGKYQP
ncbi:MAG: tetratricopeptide repeat protein, partial [Gallionellaceae bacterium]|nr:tetratricopeptide repeat protein [Gallionellaceae bacterium]